MNKLKGLFRLIRFELPFSAGVCVVMGQLLALGQFAPPLQTLYAFWSVFFISASILVFNDYFDVETDRINAPERPLPANIVSLPEALALAIGIMLTGFLLSYLLGVPALICTIILSVIGFLYNRRFKKSGLPGNLMVSFSVGMTFIYGGVSVGSAFEKQVWFFAVIAALVDLGEEIAADAMDMKGDLLIHSKSLAIRYGVKAALNISSSIFFMVVFLTVFPFILNWFRPIYMIPIVVMDLFILYFSSQLLKYGSAAGRKNIRGIYLGSTTGLVIFLLMRVLDL